MMSWIAKKRVPVPILSADWRSSFVDAAIATWFQQSFTQFLSSHWVIAIAQATFAPWDPWDLESEALIPGSEQTVRCKLRSVIHRVMMSYGTVMMIHHIKSNGHSYGQSNLMHECFDSIWWFTKRRKQSRSCFCAPAIYLCLKNSRLETKPWPLMVPCQEKFFLQEIDPGNGLVLYFGGKLSHWNNRNLPGSIKPR